MTTNNRSRVHVDVKVEAEFGVANALQLDILNTSPHPLVLACALCRHIGAFGRRLVKQSARRVTREYECPVCGCTYTVTIRV